MPKFNVVDKPIQLDLFEIIKFQLMTHCFINKIKLNETDFKCLSLLGCCGEIRLIEFCKMAHEYGIFGNPTAVNNCLSRIEQSKLFIKKGAGKKVIFLNPELDIQTKGNILLNYKIVRLETNQLQGADKTNSGAVKSA